MNDIIIVGGGISGLFTYLNLIEKGYNNIILIEKNDYFGGRIKQINIKLLDNMYSFTAGGARFNKSHINVIKLLKKFNLIDFRKDRGFTADIEFIDSKDAFISKSYSKNGFYYIQQIINKSKKETDTYLKNISFKELAYKYLPKNDVEYMLISSGYSGQLNYMNAYDAIKLFSKGIRTDITYWGGKYDILIEKMVGFINKHNGNLLLNTEVKDIIYNKEDNNYIVNSSSKKYTTKKVIFCLPQDALLKINYLNPIHCILKESITQKKLCRTYAIFKQNDIWFKNINTKVVTNNELRYIIPMDANTGLIMISYTDDKYTNYWNNIKNNKSKLKNAIVKLVKETFNIDINKPYDVIVCNWNNGVGYWNPGIDSKLISNFVINPLPNIFICGENYSLHQSWVEGALETVEKCLLHF